MQLIESVTSNEITLEMCCRGDKLKGEFLKKSTHPSKRKKIEQTVSCPGKEGALPFSSVSSTLQKGQTMKLQHKHEFYKGRATSVKSTLCKLIRSRP